LSTDGTTLGALLGSCCVGGGLVAGASSGPVTTPVTLPFNLSGSYYIIACADYLNQVVESNEANNCLAAGPIPTVLPDLVVSSFSILTNPLPSGGTVQV